MNAHTPNDTTEPPSVWFELAAVEIEVGAGAQIVKLPATVPGVLEPWHVCDSHQANKLVEGRPRQFLTICFARSIAGGELASPPARPVQTMARPAPPRAPARALSPATARRVQPPAPRGPTVTPTGMAAAVESAVSGVVEAAAAAVSRPLGEVLSALGNAPTPAPVSIPEGQACACPAPDPAVENSTAAAVPCRGCGGWIDNAQPAEQPTA